MGRKAVSMIRPQGSFVPGLRTMTPPGGVFVAAVMPYFASARRVEDRAVHRDVADHDRVVGEGRVEVVAVEQAAAGMRVSS